MRRPDSYEIRARELALAAGVDPDNRIERPGTRSMPAWCAYRDAARAEHLAVEAASVELPPQAAAYQSAPLRVFGQHDDATAAQMVERVRRIVDGEVTESVHNHHNYAWRETHDGRASHAARLRGGDGGGGEFDPFKD